MSDGNILQIKNELKKRIGTVHPILGHPIEQCEEYVKKLYIDMLCVIAWYENKDADKIMVFVQRIMSGVGLTESVSEHIKNAMEVNIKKYDEFVAQCIENKLEIIFMIDSLIVACADGKPNRKQIELLMETAEVLKLSKIQVEVISSVVKAILMQDYGEYETACAKIKESIKKDVLVNAACYTKEFVSGVLVDCEELLWLYNTEKGELSAELLKKIESVSIRDDYPKTFCFRGKTVIIENMTFVYHKYHFDCDELNLVNCNMDRTKLYFERGDAKFNNCSFTGYEVHISISSADKVIFLNCLFNNFTTEETGILYSNKACEIKFNKCMFKDVCAYKNTRYSKDSMFFLCGGKEIDFYLQECKFYNTEAAYVVMNEAGTSVTLTVENSRFNYCCGRNNENMMLASGGIHGIDRTNFSNNIAEKSKIYGMDT